MFTSLVFANSLFNVSVRLVSLMYELNPTTSTLRPAALLPSLASKHERGVIIENYSQLHGDGNVHQLK